MKLVAGWASTYAIVSLLGEVQLISLGVIGEYISKDLFRSQGVLDILLGADLRSKRGRTKGM